VSIFQRLNQSREKLSRQKYVAAKPWLIIYINTCTIEILYIALGLGSAAQESRENLSGGGTNSIDLDPLYQPLFHCNFGYILSNFQDTRNVTKGNVYLYSKSLHALIHYLAYSANGH
jgi:hypothetical protein